MSAKRKMKVSDSAEWRAKGNEIYKSFGGLCPLLRCQRLEKAIDMYNRALDLADDTTDRSSACKNIARASWELAKSKAMLTNVNENSESLHFRQALKYFKDAQQSGQERDVQWRTALTADTLECWGDIKRRLEFWEGKEQRLSELEPIVTLLFHDVTLAREQYCIAKKYLSWAATTLAKRDFKKALRFLEKCSEPLSEAVRLGKENSDLLSKCQELKNDIFDRKCVAESVQARLYGDEILKMIATKNDDLLWEAVDWYHNAAQLAHERDLELEAMALSALGRVYAKELNLQSQAEVHLTKVLELVNTMVSPNCPQEEWYLFAKRTLLEYQKDQLPQDKVKKRALILKELESDLRTITDKFSNPSKGEFLKFLYSAHPPKIGKLEAEDDSAFRDDCKMTKLYQKALTHYHPDRADEKAHGSKWKVLCEEIAKLLSKQYDVYKTIRMSKMKL